MSNRTYPLWGVSEVASYLDVPRSAVYKMTSRRSENRIPHIKIGGRLRFRKTVIDEWLDLWSVSSLDQLARAKRRAHRR